MGAGSGVGWRGEALVIGRRAAPPRLPWRRAAILRLELRIRIENWAISFPKAFLRENSVSNSAPPAIFGNPWYPGVNLDSIRGQSGVNPGSIGTQFVSKICLSRKFGSKAETRYFRKSMVSRGQSGVNRGSIGTQSVPGKCLTPKFGSKLETCHFRKFMASRGQSGANRDSIGTQSGLNPGPIVRNKTPQFSDSNGI